MSKPGLRWKAADASLSEPENVTSTSAEVWRQSWTSLLEGNNLRTEYSLFSAATQVGTGNQETVSSEVMGRSHWYHAPAQPWPLSLVCEVELPCSAPGWWMGRAEPPAQLTSAPGGVQSSGTAPLLSLIVVSVGLLLLGTEQTRCTCLFSPAWKWWLRAQRVIESLKQRIW